MPNEWRPLSRIIINGVEYQVTDEIVQGLLEVISENNTEVSLRINDLNSRINNNYSYVQDITSFLPSYANVISDWNETDSTVYTYIKNKPTIPTLVKSDWNETDTTSFAYIQNKPTIPDITGKADKSDAIGSLSLALNQSTYVITLSGTKVDGTQFTVNNQIDLPLESVVVGGNYNDTTKKVELTLKSGSTVEFSVADLVAGLQSEITSSNKLSADLIEDGTTNKVINVQSDWNVSDTTSNAYILNKPTIPTLVNANWNETDPNSPSYIQNTYMVSDELTYLRMAYTALVAEYEDDNYVISTALTDLDSRITTLSNSSFSGDYDDLTNKPTIPTLVQSDWNISDSTSSSYIKNKPTIPATQIQADWNQTATTSLDYIKNKPDISVLDKINYRQLTLYVGNNFNKYLYLQSDDGININVLDYGDINLNTDLGGVYFNNKEIAVKDDIPTVATTVTQNDTNPVSGGAVYAKFADLIGAAPAALDTLQEIATALNNDADLAGTLTSQIGAKIPKVSNPTTDNFASFNSDGTIKDSGVSASSFITTETQPDWNETNTSSVAYIQNKPTIPDDSNLVHKTGNETILGTKSFQDNIYFHGAATGEVLFNNELYDSKIRLKDDGDEGWVQIVKGNGTNAITLQAALDARNNVQADWNQTTTTAKDYIKNKPIVRTIINLENELPSRLSSAIGEENAITLTAEEASKFALFESKVRSRIDSNGYAYIYYYRGSEWEIDIDSLYNINEYYFVTYELGIYTYVTIMTDGSYEENDNVWIDTNYGSLDFVLTINKANNFGYIKKSSTSGLIKNDGTIDTNNYIISSNIASAVTQNDTNPVSGGAVYDKFEDLIGAAPAALDTLQEIATALNNDADLAGTLTTQISSKVPKVSNPTTDNFASFNSDGTIKDSGHSHSDYITSIKTVNNESLVGSGNVVISGLPQVSASDNGKILMVVNGQWQLVSPSVLYTGQGVPNNAQGNNGDIYMQTD